MTACSPASRRCVLFRCLCFLAVATVPCLARAGESAPSGDDSCPGYRNPCFQELSGTEELCGWIQNDDALNLGTHDSLPTPANKIPVLPVSSIDSSVAVAATAACASAGVYVEQIVEPFAMVGPYLDNSLGTVNQLQQWWKLAIDSAEELRSTDSRAEMADSDDMAGRVEALAAQEPVDVESFGRSVVTIVQANDEHEGELEIANNTLVGCSPVIATLEEPYLPYDLAAKDIKLWSVLPVTKRPFCVRRRLEQPIERNFWEEAERLMNQGVQVVKASQAYAHCGSADCHLDELIWKLDNLLADNSRLRQTVQPVAIGRRFATLASSGNSLFRDAAQLLASHWPEVTPDDEASPSRAGAALLARAGVNDADSIVATESSTTASPAAAPQARVADAEAGTQLR